MDILKDLIEGKGPELIQLLVSKTGFGLDQAKSFLPNAVEKILGTFKGGKLDIGSLLSGADASELVSKVDVAGLAAQSGVDPAQAEAGVRDLAGPILSEIQGKFDRPEDMLSALGGDSKGLAGKVSGLAGKFFKK